MPAVAFRKNTASPLRDQGLEDYTPGSTVSRLSLFLVEFLARAFVTRFRPAPTVISGRVFGSKKD